MAAPQEPRSESDAEGEALPRKFDRYDLLKKLATGGMAEIFLAKQSGLEGFEKVVVLKRILPHLAQDEEFVSMFLDEARIAAKLSHPNIVQIYDLGKADGTYYIAMEYVSGRNVQHLIGKQQERGEPIPVEHVVRVCAGVCDGLYYAHSRKDYDGTPLSIVHRDISPQNILVSFAGGVKLVDFGIAKASTQIAQTRAGVLKGKYAYMSPEQVRGSRVDHRSDIFAVGLVMYEMLTGQRAFERETSLKTLKAIVQEKPLNPRELNPDVPMEVVKLLSKALEKNPDKRYKTAQEMQLALEEYLESSPKKSNNVRLSRYMYDIFDDELNSKDGTMVVKGVGEVIIPASKGLTLEPRVEEEVDHRTLTAALAPQPSGAAPAPNGGAVRVVHNERGAPVPSAPKATVREKTPARNIAPPPDTGAHGGDDDDSDDGRTIPATDLDELERKRAAKKAAATSAPASDESREDDDRTVAGVPPPSAEGRERSDAKAAALLAKVDAMAAGGAIADDRAAMAAEDDVATRTSMPAHPRGSTDDPDPSAQEPPVDGTQEQPLNTDEVLAPKPSMVVGPNGRVDPIRQVRPAGRPMASPLVDGQTSDTPAPGTLRGDASTGPLPAAASRPIAPAPPAPRAKEPRVTRPARASNNTQRVFYAAVAGTILLCGMSIALLVFILKAVPAPAAGAQEFALVHVTTSPPGARVTVDGRGDEAATAPAQVLVEKAGEHVVEIKLDGHESVTRKVTFGSDEALVRLDVALKAAP